MKAKEITAAAQDGRLALCPDWLMPGREVWYWRESLCGDDGCPDMVTSCCPLNHGIAWYEDTARECSQQHPVLEHTTVWSAGAYFTPRGVEWMINDLPAVADVRLLSAFYRTEKEAWAARPGRIAEF